MSCTKVKIIKENKDSVRFYPSSDPDKTEQVYPRKYIESVERNVSIINSNDTVFERQCQEWKFTEVIKTKGSPSELFVKGKTWAVSNIPGIENIEENKEAFRLVYKGIFPTDGIYHGEVQFLITIEFKDNKYRYTLEQFQHKNGVVVNAFHTQPSNGGVKTFDYGSLTNEKPSVSGMLTGHSARCWEKIKSITKNNTYTLITSLKGGLSETYSKDW